MTMPLSKVAALILTFASSTAHSIPERGTGRRAISSARARVRSQFMADSISTSPIGDNGGLGARPAVSRKGLGSEVARIPDVDATGGDVGALRLVEAC